jgi:hypothetical protein
MAKKEKVSAKELMDSVIDLDLLEKRKERSNKSKKNVEEVIEEKKVELKWFQKPMVKDNFSIVEKGNKYYLHYSEWGDKVHIGPYEDKSIIDLIIEMYIKETKKTNILKRRFKTEIIHSLLLE